MRRRTKFGLFSLITLGVMSGGVLMGLANGNGAVGALTYSTYQRVDFTFNSAIQITLSSGDLMIPSLTPGSSSDSNIIDITAGTNVSTGLQLTATVGRNNAGETPDPYNTTNLINGSNSFATLSSTAASLDSSDFGANKWGYSYCTAEASVCNSTEPAVIAANWVSGDAGATSAGYNGLPLHSATGVKLVETNSNSSSALKFKIGAKASDSQASGTYSNMINFTAVTKVVPTSYTVNFYNVDGASNVPSTNPITGTTSTDIPVYLGSGQNQTTAPSKDGYVFEGWCTAETNNASCSGNVYQADETYMISAVGSSVTVNLYAMWKNNPVEEYVMQEVADWKGDLEVGDEVTATDSRDGKTYTVAKLADGNIWMTQNLDHDIVTTTNFYTYANTDIGHGATPNTGATWTGTATYATSNTAWNWSADAPESYDPGDVCWLGEGETDYDTCGEDKHYHLGNYYNWTAAVAMSNSGGYTEDGDIVEQSICPAGWTLPLGGSETGSKSFYNLISQYDWDNSSYMMSGSYSMWDSPLYFSLGGSWRGYLDYVGYDGYYWSSVVNDSDIAYYLYFSSDDIVGPDDYGYRSDGFSVRCVAR